MPLIDSLQSGYPTVQPGQGTSLLDLLQGLLAPSGNAPTSAPSTYAMGTPDPMAAGPQFTDGTGAPMGFGSAAIPQAPAAQPPVLPAAAPAPSAPTGSPLFQPSPADIQSSPVPAGTGAMPGAPGLSLMSGAPAGPSPDASQDPSQGGLIGSFGTQLASAAQSPDASKGLLQQFADTAKNVGQQLTNLSPSASQALIASGLTILAGNDGTRNLAQLVGQGGIAGVNAYDTSRQNIIANNLAQQKVAQTASQQQFEQQLKGAQFGLDNRKFAYDQTKPVAITPGQSLVNPQTGQSIVQGAPQVARTIDVQMPDGTTVTRQYGQNGQQIGPDIPKNNPYIGPLSGDQFAAVNAANAQAATSAQALQKTNALLAKVTPTIPDPNNPGATIANPNYVPMSSGVAATVGNAWNNLFGDQSQGQQVRNEIQSTIRATNMQQFKGVGRFDNMDMIALQKGMPPDNASTAALNQYLTAYGHLQEAQAINDQANAAYVTANRGSTAPLNVDTNIGGVVYPAQTSYQAIMTGTATPKQAAQTQPVQQQPQNGGTYSLSAIDAAIARKKGR